MACEATLPSSAIFLLKAAMDRSFVTATDDRLIELITSAKHRLAVITPGLTTSVARSVAARMHDLPQLALTVVLDADPEVYRMGYGDTEALNIIRNASVKHMFDLREQPGVRIGLVISDDRTIVYAPVSRNVEAGSTTADKPNAIEISGRSTNRLAEACGVDEGEQGAQEIGKQGMEPGRVEQMQVNLQANPPQPADLTRRLTVFQSEVQFIELTVRNSRFSTRKITLPPEFQKITDKALKQNINSRLAVPIDLDKRVEVTIATEHGPERLKINEAYIEKERARIEDNYLYLLKRRGKVILRRNKDPLARELDRLQEMIKAYRKALHERFEEHRNEFCQTMLKEFVEMFLDQPPPNLVRRQRVDRASCERYIEMKAGDMFDEAVSFGPPEHVVVYKEFAIEDLQNAKLMLSLKRTLDHAFVDRHIIERLFRTESAYGVKPAPLPM